MIFWNGKQAMARFFALILWGGSLCSTWGHHPFGHALHLRERGTSKPAETIPVNDGLAVEIVAEPPSETATRLQVLYFFEYRAGEKNLGANHELDHKLHGIIQDLRQSGKFAARPLETLVLVPPPYSIRPRQLLLIGLGKPEELSLDLIKSAGRVGMREALRLGVRQYAQTFDWRDDKTATLGVGEMARSLIEGALAAYAVEKELQARGLADEQPMTRITLLTTLAAYKEIVQAVKTAISNAPQSTRR